MNLRVLMGTICMLMLMFGGAYAIPPGTGQDAFPPPGQGEHDPHRDQARLHLRAGGFTPEPGLTAMSRGEIYLVQFTGPVLREWREWLGSMGDILGYIPMDAYIFRAGEDIPLRVLSSHDHLRWIGEFRDVYRVEPGLTSRVPEKVTVLTFPGTDLPEALRTVTGEGGYPEQVYPVGGGYSMVLSQVTPDLIRRLAGQPWTMWIEAYHPPVLRNDVAQWLIQSRVQGLRPVWDHGILGEGQIIGNADAGADTDHDAFRDGNRSVQVSSQSNPLPPDMMHRKVVNYWDFGSMSSGHGTSTASINAGDDTPNGGTGQYNGMAPKAKMSIQGWNNINQITPFFDAAYGDGARVHSDSWGNDNGRYDAWAVELDQFVWDHQEFLPVIAIANRGPGTDTISSPESAKNCVAVGAGAKDTSGSVDSYSARGPAEDGRLRPSIIGPSHEVAASAGSGNRYSNAGSGTSFAAPAVAGGLVLIREYFADGFYPTGKKNAADGFNASAALVKAVLLNGAVEINGSGAHTNPYNGMPYPNVDQGWGMINLDAALYFEGDARKLFVVDERVGLNTGDSKGYDVYVESRSEPLEVTLVYSDYPGQPSASRNLVNDLDLEVTSPSGQVYKGNVYVTSGTPHQSETGGSFDTLNNEEGVLRYSPETGLWKVKVSARDVPNGPQPFALAAVGAFAPPTGVQIDSPKGGDLLRGGENHTISWTSVGGIVSVELAYSPDGGGTWTDIVTGQPANGTYAWSVPKIDSTQMLVRATGIDGPGKTYVSRSGVFSVDSTPPESRVLPLPKVTLVGNFDLNLSMSDAISGVDTVEVFYRADGGVYTSAGRTNATPLPFTAPSDGYYEFYTTAVDGAGWVEAAPPSPDAGTLVDTVPPSVVSTEPSDGAVDVPLRIRVRVTFSEPMDKGATASAVSASGGSISGMQWTDRNTTLEFTLDGLDPGVAYTITLSGDAADLAGRSLAPYTFNFTTTVDTQAPDILETMPRNGDADVPVNTTVRITFSEEMDRASAQAAFSVMPEVRGTFTWDATTMVFTPSLNLSGATGYTVVVSTAGKDLAGNHLPEEYTFTFSTAGPRGGPRGNGNGGVLGAGPMVDLLVLLLVVVLACAGIAAAVLRRRRRPPAYPVWVEYPQGYPPAQYPGWEYAPPPPPQPPPAG